MPQPHDLLDPLQIEEYIKEYYRKQPSQGARLWSLIKGNDHLLRAWKAYALEVDDSSEPPVHRVGWLRALIARIANPNRPTSMERLTYMLGRFIPDVFQPAAHDWLNIIGDEHLYGFFESLAYAIIDSVNSVDPSRPFLDNYWKTLLQDVHLIDGMQTCAEQYHSLKPEGRSKRLILVIDHEPMTRQIHSAILSVGFREQAVTVSTIGGASALILSSTLLPDLILARFNGLGMEEYVFAERLKKNPVRQNVPLVLLIPRGMRGPGSVNWERWRELGVTEVLTLPVSPRQLVSLVERVLGIEAQPLQPRGGT